MKKKNGRRRQEEDLRGADDGKKQEKQRKIGVFFSGMDRVSDSIKIQRMKEEIENNRGCEEYTELPFSAPVPADQPATVYQIESLIKLVFSLPLPKLYRVRVNLIKNESFLTGKRDF